MEVSIRSLVDLSWHLFLYAFIVGVLGLVTVGVEQAIKKGEFSLRSGGLITKAGMACTLLAILGLVMAFIGFIFAGFWWTWSVFFEDMSPGRLAIYSLMLGPVPLVFPLLAKTICKLMGGSVDASQARNCVFLGIDFGGLLHAFFMAYWLVIFTAGFAVIGLIGSAVWVMLGYFS